LRAGHGGGEVDDCSTGAEWPSRQPVDGERAVDVSAVGLVELSQVQGRNSSRPHDTGGVHEGVDSPEFNFDFIEGCGHRLFIGDIAADCDSPTATRRRADAFSGFKIE
jgi:hypothetical protein